MRKYAGERCAMTNLDPQGFLNLLAAYLPEGRRYSGRGDDWYAAFGQLARKFPDLLDVLEWTFPPDASFYSQDLDQWLTLLRIGGARIILEGGNLWFEFPEGWRTVVITVYERRASDGTKEGLRMMALELSKILPSESL